MITIIAEVGCNHCGEIALAKHLMRLAPYNGADLVKFQLYDTDKLHKPDFKFYQECKQAELTFGQANELFQHGRAWGIEVFFSVADAERVKWCEEIGVKRYKIAARMRHEDVLEAIEQTGKPVIMSSADAEFKRFKDTKLLYCVSKYPTETKDLDFNNVDFRYLYDGFSDHNIGLDACKIAIARGAQIIEKHFAIDYKTGVDAPWSMTPSELKELRRFANIVDEAL